MLVPTPATPICRVSVPTPPSYLSPAWIWPVSVTIRVSSPSPASMLAACVAPVMISLPLVPVTLIASVPVPHVTKVQADISNVAPDTRFTASVWFEEVPVTATDAEILPAPN